MCRKQKFREVKLPLPGVRIYRSGRTIKLEVSCLNTGPLSLLKFHSVINLAEDTVAIGSNVEV
jgi:hypothetical protein